MARSIQLLNRTEMQDHATQPVWTYNNERPNMGLGGFTPSQKFNRQMATQIATWVLHQSPFFGGMTISLTKHSRE